MPRNRPRSEEAAPETPVSVEAPLAPEADAPAAEVPTTAEPVVEAAAPVVEIAPETSAPVVDEPAAAAVELVIEVAPEPEPAAVPAPEPEPSPVDLCKPHVIRLLSVTPYSDLPDAVEWLGRMHGVDGDTAALAISELIADHQIQAEEAEAPAPELAAIPEDIDTNPEATRFVETPTKRVMRLRRRR